MLYPDTIDTCTHCEYINSTLIEDVYTCKDKLIVVILEDNYLLYNNSTICNANKEVKTILSNHKENNRCINHI